MRLKGAMWRKFAPILLIKIFVLYFFFHFSQMLSSDQKQLQTLLDLGLKELKVPPKGLVNAVFCTRRQNNNVEDAQIDYKSLTVKRDWTPWNAVKKEEQQCQRKLSGPLFR